MLSTGRSKVAHVLDHENINMTLKHNTTNFVQIPPRTETEFFAKEATVDLLKRCEKTGPFQEMLLSDCPKSRMIREHIHLPLLDHGQITTPLHLLQQAIHKPREFTECQIAIVSAPRVQFGEIVCN